MAQGVARSGFDLDLAHGEAREGALGRILSLRYGDRIEVKSDGKARSTGNLFVEFRQKGRPSGIAVTEAEWWSTEVYDDVWIILPTVVLKRLASRAYHEGRTKLGGDGDLYEGILIPVAWLTDPAVLA